ncbi:cellulose synthase complex periplasmic endoglucanase BcsZ [Paraburkholderia sp.]|uniref:cellulose synthase complex periplasmic endoglucanase BcsZ n=1 Tax=Paraburkholderia sp. TaxID=1926495 RepID=UPI0025CC6EC5|nr:cellulose synthase complex periplasmic endoglucanase BcsZ [Paraburkholderia sp.]
MVCGGTTLAAVGMSAPAAAVTCGDWPSYRTFVERFVQADGRVIDFSTASQQTTSEGQSYAMFFALVANDRATFDLLLAWTRKNLAGGQFDANNVRLPAWQWGRKPDGSWGVLDPNPASDSDLWIAYDLLQAGRLWNAPNYTALGTELAAQIVGHEVADLAGLGPMLLPGPDGFVNAGVTRLNPSYMPLPLLRGLAHDLRDGPWTAIAKNTLKIVMTTSPHGFTPDWAAWRQGQFVVDPKTGDLGSYDAIRVYLWAALAAPSDPLAKPWLNAVHGMNDRVTQTRVPPEKVAVTTGNGTGEGPLSYWGALAPYFAVLGDTRNLALARAHLTALDNGAPGYEPVYYDRVLGLFGTGALDGRYRFDVNGQLIPAWRGACE